MQKIGVFVCWCGSNIAATVDVERVAEAVKSEPGVVYSTNYQYMCSENGQAMIRNAIKEYGLNGVVICSCSPRMHEATFRKTAMAAGLNPYMVEIANIREQCSWIHKDMQEGTEKAIILARAAIAKVLKNAPLTAGTSPVTKRALVVGGGIAGNPDRAGRGGRRIRGGHCGEIPHHRRPHGAVGQDLPHPGLRSLHPHPEDGGRGAERKDRYSLLQRIGIRERFCGQLYGQDPQKGALCG